MIIYFKSLLPTQIAIDTTYIVDRLMKHNRSQRSQQTVTVIN